MTETLRFTKGQGTGNDFVLVADPENSMEFSAETIAALCDRHFGIGADGFIRAVRTAALPEAAELHRGAPEAEWFMDYRNADGSLAEMCGNGIRVFLKYLLAENLTELPQGHSIAIATRAGVIDLTQTALSVQLDLGRWKLQQQSPSVTAPGIAPQQPSVGINVGNPHVVVQLEAAEQLAELDLSALPQLDPVPEDGANIEFIVPAKPLVKDGVGRIQMRVYERGVGETLSCGTGVVAAALAARHLAGPGAPNHWQVTVPGGSLGVRMFPTEEGEHVSLSGPAELVYSGHIQLPLT